MAKPDREEALRRIRESKKCSVILVSFKAGSTGTQYLLATCLISYLHMHTAGLNLTCCNNVILVDLWWNPALEEQAFDRAHRLGQERDVNIYKLTIKETVEDRILQVGITFMPLPTCRVFRGRDKVLTHLHSFKIPSESLQELR
jgi:hypothetical protein